MPASFDGSYTPSRARELCVITSEVLEGDKQWGPTTRLYFIPPLELSHPLDLYSVIGVVLS